MVRWFVSVRSRYATRREESELNHRKGETDRGPHPQRRWARPACLIAAVIGMSGGVSGDATANIGAYGRHDYVAKFSRGTAVVAIDGGGGGTAIVNVRAGTMSFTSHDGRCVPSPEALRTCRYTTNSMSFDVADFEISDVTVSKLAVSSWVPVPNQSSLFGLMSIPSGTPFNASAIVNGEASAFPVRAGAALSFKPEEDVLSVIAEFKGTVDGRTLDIVVQATADTPFANHPPRANAGADQAHLTSCFAQVKLDSSGSSDPDGNFSHAFFTEHGIPIGSHAQPVNLLPGKHVFALEARDTRRARDIDEVIVDISDDGTTSAVPGATLFRVEVPRGLTPEAVAILSTSELSIGPHASVQPRSNGAVVVNLGGGRTTLGVSSRSNDLWSRGPVVVHPDAIVSGSVHTRSPVDAKNRASVLGTIDEQALFDPLVSTSWNVVLSTSGLGNFVVPAETTRRISPGRYASIIVEPKALLEIEPGVYAADELLIGSNARAELVGAGGLQFYVSSNVQYKGPIVVPDPSAFILAYSGTTTAFLNEPFTGTLVAPHARVVLAGPGGTHHSGAWFAGDVDVRPGVVVEHRPFAWETFRATRSACAVTPTLKCVRSSAGGWIARFGYENALTYTGVSVPLGAFNRFAPGPEFRGQPVAFAPGANPEEFEVPFDGAPITWVLGSRSVTASKETTSCP
jgi:hypothetical protein